MEKKPKHLVEPLTANQYPKYFSIWQGKHPSIEDIRVESKHLSEALRLNKDIVMQGFFDFVEDKVVFDALVYHKRDFERGK